MNRFWLSLSLLALNSSAHACLNDRDSDSLATQAAKFPDTLRVITGRFERNPPVFYQMRIERESAQLKKTPRNFGLYDDIAVAFDKLHRDDDALRIMAQKRALLPPFDAENAALKEAWYRYYANAGTFRAHRFLGDKSQPIGEMRLARDFIKRAIEIKPNAHFGREKVQLMAMGWILATKTKKTSESFADFLSTHEKWSDKDGELIDTKKMQAATERLSGLIVLGAAWQSVDVFDALAASLNTKGGIALSHFAYLRVQELLKQGHKSLSPQQVNATKIEVELLNSRSLDYESGINDKNQKTLNQQVISKIALRIRNLEFEAPKIYVDAARKRRSSRHDPEVLGRVETRRAAESGCRLVQRKTGEIRFYQLAQPERQHFSGALVAWRCRSGLAASSLVFPYAKIDLIFVSCPYLALSQA